MRACRWWSACSGLGESGEATEAAGEAASGVGPRDLLNAHATAATLHAPDGVPKMDKDGAEREGLPEARLGPAVVTRCPPTAAAAAWELPRRTNIDDEGRTTESHVADEHAADAEEAAE